MVTKFYSGVPPLQPNVEGATDAIYPPRNLFVNLTEGFSFGFTNNEGYNNSFNYTSGMNIDVLVMGSSYMQAMNVICKNNAANILNQISGEKIYNIGISAHFLPISARNLKAALKKYKPSKWIIIETPQIDFNEYELNNIINNTVPLQEIAKKSRGLLRSVLRKNYYLYLLYGKYNMIFNRSNK